MDIIKYLEENWDLNKIPAEKRDEYVVMIGEIVFRQFTNEAEILLNEEQLQQLATLLELPGTNPITVINFYNSVLGEDVVQKMIKSQLDQVRNQVMS